MQASGWLLVVLAGPANVVVADAASAPRRSPRRVHASAAAPSVWKSCASTGGPRCERAASAARAHTHDVRRYRCCLADGFVSGAGRTGERGWRGACRTTTTTTTAATTTKRLAQREGTQPTASVARPPRGGVRWVVRDGRRWLRLLRLEKTSPASNLARLPFSRHRLAAPHTPTRRPLARDDSDRHVLRIAPRSSSGSSRELCFFFFPLSLTPEQLELPHPLP